MPGSQNSEVASPALMAGMGGKLTLRLALQMASSRGDFSQAIRESVLNFGVVGIQIHCLAGVSFESRRQVEKECFRHRMYRPNRLNSAAPCPLRWMSQGIACGSFGHVEGLIQVGYRRNQRPANVSERYETAGPARVSVGWNADIRLAGSERPRLSGARRGHPTGFLTPVKVRRFGGLRGT